jgi:thioredoxin 1
MPLSNRKFASALVCLMAILASPTTRSGPRDIYPPISQAAADIASALKLAAATHQRIIVDFGGNWCTDCLVLDSYFHNDANKALLDANYILVHVNVGHLDSNLSLAEQYQIPLKKGVPAIAVLDERGRLLYSQRSGEFEAMRDMQASAVTDFLTRWRPAHSP